MFFLLSAVHVLDIDTAFSLAKWSGLGLTGFYGFWAARAAGRGLLSALLHGTAIALIGGFLIAPQGVGALAGLAGGLAAVQHLAVDGAELEPRAPARSRIRSAPCVPAREKATRSSRTAP